MVRIVQSNWVPPGMYAWVPLPEKIVVKRGQKLYTFAIAHEFVHVIQWRKHGWWFPLRYLWGWVRAGFRYAHNEFEIEATEQAFKYQLVAEVLIKRAGE